MHLTLIFVDQWYSGSQSEISLAYIALKPFSRHCVFIESYFENITLCIRSCRFNFDSIQEKRFSAIISYNSLFITLFHFKRRDFQLLFHTTLCLLLYFISREEIFRYYFIQLFFLLLFNDFLGCEIFAPRPWIHLFHQGIKRANWSRLAFMESCF